MIPISTNATNTVGKMYPMSGKHHTKETKDKIRASALGRVISAEQREKLRVANLGKTHTQEWKDKMSNRVSGESHPMFGKHFSEESKKKMSRSAKQYLDAHPEKLELLRARTKGKVLSEETRMKMSIANKKRYENPIEYNKLINLRKGKKASEETLKRMSECKRGEKSPNWKGGISFKPYCPKFNNNFKERVRKFFGYICVLCGKPQGKRALHVHHVNYDKQTCCNNSKPLFVPLCGSCHSKTINSRYEWESYFEFIINTNYGGKCYIPIGGETCLHH